MHHCFVCVRFAFALKDNEDYEQRKALSKQRPWQRDDIFRNFNVHVNIWRRGLGALWLSKMAAAIDFKICATFHEICKR